MSKVDKNTYGVFVARGITDYGPHNHIGYFEGKYQDVFDYVSLVHSRQLGYGLELLSVEIKKVDPSRTQLINDLTKRKKELEKQIGEIQSEIDKTTK